MLNGGLEVGEHSTVVRGADGELIEKLSLPNRAATEQAAAVEPFVEQPTVASEIEYPPAGELTKWFVETAGGAAVGRFRAAFDSCKPRFGYVSANLLTAALNRRGVPTNLEEAHQMIATAAKLGATAKRPSQCADGLSFAQFFHMMARRYWGLRP